MKLTIERDQTGRITASYLSIAGRQVVHTNELVAGKVFIDRDARGNVLGIEILGDFKLVERRPQPPCPPPE